MFIDGNKSEGFPDNFVFSERANLHHIMAHIGTVKFGNKINKFPYSFERHQTQHDDFSIESSSTRVKVPPNLYGGNKQQFA